MFSVMGSPRSRTKVSLRPKEYMGVLFLLCGDRSNQIRKVRGHTRLETQQEQRARGTQEHTKYREYKIRVEGGTGRTCNGSQDMLRAGSDTVQLLF